MLLRYYYLLLRPAFNLSGGFLVKHVLVYSMKVTKGLESITTSDRLLRVRSLSGSCDVGAGFYPIYDGQFGGRMSRSEETDAPKAPRMIPDPPGLQAMGGKL